MDEEYEFVANGDACGVCQALDGTTCSALPHEACMCQIVPKESGCQVKYNYSGHYYGPSTYDGGASGEIEVECPDGSVIGESFDVEFDSYRNSGLDVSDIAADAFEAEAEALCAQCKEPEPFLCC
jgi:hypothetical protein